MEEKTKRKRKLNGRGGQRRRGGEWTGHGRIRVVEGSRGQREEAMDGWTRGK